MPYNHCHMINIISYYFSTLTVHRQSKAGFIPIPTIFCIFFVLFFEFLYAVFCCNFNNALVFPGRIRFCLAFAPFNTLVYSECAYSSGKSALYKSHLPYLKSNKILQQIFLNMLPHRSTLLIAYP